MKLVMNNKSYKVTMVDDRVKEWSKWTPSEPPKKLRGKNYHKPVTFTDFSDSNRTLCIIDMGDEIGWETNAPYIGKGGIFSIYYDKRKDQWWICYLSDTWNIGRTDYKIGFRTNVLWDDGSNRIAIYWQDKVRSDSFRYYRCTFTPIFEKLLRDNDILYKDGFWHHYILTWVTSPTNLTYRGAWDCHLDFLRSRKFIQTKVLEEKTKGIYEETYYYKPLEPKPLPIYSLKMGGGRTI